MQKRFYLYPSVDVVNRMAMTSNSAISLTRGEVETKSEILGTPAEITQLWEKSGASWIHIVDLDAASGKKDNYDAIAEAVASVNVNVQVCGGIRDDKSLNRVLRTGCERINISTAVLENPYWCEKIISEHGDKIAIALDVKPTPEGYILTKKGWNIPSDNLWRVIERLEKYGCQRYVVTDISKGGKMSRPNFQLLKEITNFTDSPIISGGGVSNLNDIKMLSEMLGSGVEGTVIGQALHIGKISFPEAMSVVT